MRIASKTGNVYIIICDDGTELEVTSDSTSSAFKEAQEFIAKEQPKPKKKKGRGRPKKSK